MRGVEGWGSPVPWIGSEAGAADEREPFADKLREAQEERDRPREKKRPPPPEIWQAVTMFLERAQPNADADADTDADANAPIIGGAAPAPEGEAETDAPPATALEIEAEAETDAPVEPETYKAQRAPMGAVPEKTMVRFELPLPEAAPPPAAPATTAVAVAPTPAPTAPQAVAPAAIAAPAPIMAPEPMPERGHIGTARAEIVIGEGDDRLAVRISAAGTHIKVEATTAAASLAMALQRGAGELKTALGRHGLELTKLGADTDTEERPQSDVARVNRRTWRTRA